MPTTVPLLRDAPPHVVHSNSTHFPRTLDVVLMLIIPRSHVVGVAMLRARLPAVRMMAVVGQDCAATRAWPVIPAALLSPRLSGEGVSFLLLLLLLLECLLCRLLHRGVLSSGSLLRSDVLHRHLVRHLLCLIGRCVLRSSVLRRRRVLRGGRVLRSRRLLHHGGMPMRRSVLGCSCVVLGRRSLLLLVCSCSVLCKRLLLMRLLLMDCLLRWIALFIPSRRIPPHSVRARRLL